MDNILEVSGLGKSYRNFALKDVSFSLPEGCITGFIGVNGAGKTTTLRALLRLTDKDAGQIQFFGLDMERNEKQIKDRLGIVLDDGCFYEELTLAEMKSIIAPAYTAWSERDFKQYMDMFSLDPKQKINTLSKGMRMNDYTLNSVHPCWYGAYNEPIDARAGIAWLAKTQGYTKGRLRRVLCKGDMANPNSFLESMRVELANLSSAMSTVTFLVELTLAQLLELNRLIKLQDRNGRHYDSSENPYCGYIIIDKNTETGLYDPWNGDGSVFEIQLERDVKLPIKYIRSTLPDGGDGYSIGSVYGMCGSAWTSGGVKTIHAPVKLTA